MQAKTFFAVVIEANRARNHEREFFLYDLIDIAQVAQANSKWINELKTFFWNRVNRFLIKPVDIKKGVPVSGDEAAGAIMAAIQLKKRVEGLA